MTHEEVGISKSPEGMSDVGEQASGGKAKGAFGGKQPRAEEKYQGPTEIHGKAEPHAAGGSDDLADRSLESQQPGGEEHSDERRPGGGKILTIRGHDIGANQGAEKDKRQNDASVNFDGECEEFARMGSVFRAEALGEHRESSLAKDAGEPHEGVEPLIGGVEGPHLGVAVGLANEHSGAGPIDGTDDNPAQDSGN